MDCGLPRPCLQIILKEPKRKSDLSLCPPPGNWYYVGGNSLGCQEEILQLKASFVWDHGTVFHFLFQGFELTQKGPAVTYFKASTFYTDRDSQAAVEAVAAE